MDALVVDSECSAGTLKCGIGLQSVEKERDRVEERSACALRETDSVELGISTHVERGGI